MNAPAKGLLKVSSILLIVFGSIGVFFTAISLACAVCAANLISNATSDISLVVGVLMAPAVTPMLIIGSLLGIVACAAELVLGIMGMKRYADVAQGNFFIVGGIILCGLQLISMILYFSFFSLTGFVLPILFIVGGFMNKNAVAPAAPAAQ